MARVLAVHGINQHRSSRDKMHAAWLEALTAGLSNIRSPHGAEIELEVAFYGHEYNDGKATGFAENAGPADLEDGFEFDLLLSIAASCETELLAADEKVYLPQLVQQALAVIQRSALFDGTDERLISFVKQVHRYLFDEEFRDRVLHEMDVAMAAEPRVVIGHSLGSIVAYDWLLRQRPSTPPHLVTIGSPMGLEAIKRGLGAPPPANRPMGFVPTWTNVAAGHDAVAMVKELHSHYHPDIEDFGATLPRKGAHSALNYLANVQTARAVDRVLQ